MSARAAPGPAGAAARPGAAGQRDPVRQARLADPGVRGGLRQGRRRQVLGDGQPGGRAGRPRPVGRRGRRRHLRAQRAADARASTGRPTQVEQMIMPPQAYGVRVISIGMFTPGNTAGGVAGADAAPGAAAVPRRRLLGRPRRAAARPAAGHRRHRHLGRPAGAAPRSCWWSPRRSSPPQEVAERAGSIALQTHQQIVGVVENMSWWEQPDGSRVELFGAGGGAAVAASLSRLTGATVPLLGQIPIDQRLREGGDAGLPIVVSAPESPAAVALDRGGRPARPPAARAGRASSSASARPAARPPASRRSRSSRRSTGPRSAIRWCPGRTAPARRRPSAADRGGAAVGAAADPLVRPRRRRPRRGSSGRTSAG